jgi:hypothetical protein
MTFLLQLRDAAKDCSNVDYRAKLRQAADSVDVAIRKFAADSTQERMIDLNGAWSHAQRVLKNVPPEGEPAPVGGAPEPAKLALAA